MRRIPSLLCACGLILVAFRVWSGARGTRKRTARRPERTEPFLRTEHLVLRPLVPEDAWGARGIHADPDKGPPDLEDIRRRIEALIEYRREHGLALWAVIERRTGVFAGVCGMFRLEGRGPEVELAYRLWLPPRCRHYTKEAVTESLRHGFEDLGLGRIIAVADPDDPACARALGILEGAGMAYEGTRKLYGRELFVYSAERGAGA